MPTDLDQRFMDRLRTAVNQGRQPKQLIAAYDYDSIALLPTLPSTLKHRAEADTSTTFDQVYLATPIIGSPMKDVCDGKMTASLWNAGGLGILHRFQSIEEQVEEFRLHGVECAAVGVTGDWEERFLELYRAGCRCVCLDTANGVNTQVKDVIYWIKGYDPKVFVVAGNVGSPRTFMVLEEWGADAIRVGIGSGSVCETRTETGVYTPMAWLVQMCSLVKDKALVIADGGIKSPSDFCKAIALGADLVMLGGVLAGALESPGWDSKMPTKRFRGSASFSVQQENGVNEPAYIEGTDRRIIQTGTVQEIVTRYKRGLQSSMSYMDSRTLDEYRERAQIAFVGQTV